MKRKKINFKHLAVVVGSAGGIGLNITFYILFCHAYFFNNFYINGYINAIGEANLELVLFLFFVILNIYSVVYLLNVKIFKKWVK